MCFYGEAPPEQALAPLIVAHRRRRRRHRRHLSQLDVTQTSPDVTVTVVLLNAAARSTGGSGSTVNNVSSCANIDRREVRTTGVTLEWRGKDQRQFLRDCTPTECHVILSVRRFGSRVRRKCKTRKDVPKTPPKRGEKKKETKLVESGTGICLRAPCCAARSRKNTLRGRVVYRNALGADEDDAESRENEAPTSPSANALRACDRAGKTHAEKADRRNCVRNQTGRAENRSTAASAACRLVGLARAQRSRPSARGAGRTRPNSREAARSEFDDGRRVRRGGRGRGRARLGTVTMAIGTDSP